VINNTKNYRQQPEYLDKFRGMSHLLYFYYRGSFKTHQFLIKYRWQIPNTRQLFGSRGKAVIRLDIFRPVVHFAVLSESPQLFYYYKKYHSKLAAGVINRILWQFVEFNSW
jgi:hypothetical protein